MKNFLSGILSLAPAVLYGGAILTFQGEYYFPLYMVMAVVFGTASLGLTLIMFKFAGVVSGWVKGFGIALIALSLAWVLALMTLGLLNLTPLCVGQDNGDGSNNLAICVVQTVLVSFFFSFPMSIPVGLTAALVSWLRLPARNDE